MFSSLLVVPFLIVLVILILIFRSSVSRAVIDYLAMKAIKREKKTEISDINFLSHKMRIILKREEHIYFACVCFLAFSFFALFLFPSPFLKCILFPSLPLPFLMRWGGGKNNGEKSKRERKEEKIKFNRVTMMMIFLLFLLAFYLSLSYL